MQCSMCKEQACYIIYHYKNDKSIEFIEGRCNTHFNLDKKQVKQDRKIIRNMRQGKRPKYEIEKLADMEK